MTLPLLTQDRWRMEGIRYSGAIASVHPDVEYQDHVWANHREFQFGVRPPFRWAGRQQEGR